MPGIEENTFFLQWYPLIVDTRGQPSVFLALFQKWTPHFYHHSMTLPHGMLPAYEAFR